MNIQTLAEYWADGVPIKNIAHRCGKTPNQITARITKLRKNHPHLFPHRYKPRKKTDHANKK